MSYIHWEEITQTPRVQFGDAGLQGQIKDGNPDMPHLPSSHTMPCLDRGKQLVPVFAPVLLLFHCLFLITQALGWSLLLILIVAVFLARWLRPCFNQATLLQARHWSNYIDIEQKIFEETCCEHSRLFAHKCILHFFESMQQEIKLHSFSLLRQGEGTEGEEGLLWGITDQDQVNKLLKMWYYEKPPLNVTQATQRHPLGRERSPPPWADSPSTRSKFPQHTDV